MSELARVEQLLRRTIGLDPESVGPARIGSAVRRRMSVTGLADADLYASRIAHDPAELQELVEAVVVPETFFFREPAALAALARMVRSGQLRATADAPLHVLSVPCSTGEEPYSIAMTLLTAGCARDAIHVDGVDVSHDAVRLAEAASYSVRSFRGRTPEYPEYFVEQGDTVRVRADVRSSVRITWGNVFAEDFAPPQTSYDVIFCRNLLIYFDAPSRDRVLRILAGHLHPNGVLFVAPADAFVVRAGGFQGIGDAASCAFRRHDDATSRLGTTAERSIAHLATRTTVTPVAPRRGLPDAGAPRSWNAGELRDAAVASPAVGIEPIVAEMTALANAGRYRYAADLGESAVRSSVATADFFTLLGTIQETLANHDRAESCYRSALYLEPSNTGALLHLADLFGRRGDQAAALRLKQRAQRGGRAE